MESYKIKYTNAMSTCYFDGSFDSLKALAPIENSFIITDEHLMIHYQGALKHWPVIVIPPGESSKSLEVLDDVLRQLLALDAGRDALIIGFGGGVVTDIAGFVAGIYKRGLRCALVPTSVLAMVDAAIGGKNGLDIGDYKNMIGLIRQPEFLLFDYGLLRTLPEEEWINGFAEIIKHACIKDEGMFADLERYILHDYQKDPGLLDALIRRNVLLKAGIVQADELEVHERKWLNFGHTLAHAIENVYQLPHGHAVAIGMVSAAKLSESLCGFTDYNKVERLLQQYQLPVSFDFDRDRAWQYMRADKKMSGDKITYVLLEKIGKAVLQPLTMSAIKTAWA